MHPVGEIAMSDLPAVNAAAAASREATVRGSVFPLMMTFARHSSPRVLRYFDKSPSTTIAPSTPESFFGVDPVPSEQALPAAIATESPAHSDTKPRKPALFMRGPYHAEGSETGRWPIVSCDSALPDDLLHDSSR